MEIEYWLEFVRENFDKAYENLCLKHDLDIIIRDSGLQVFRERAKRMPAVIADSFKPVLDEDYYLAECQHCGWWGSLRLLKGGGFLAGCGDYDDVYCPLCGSSDIESKEL
jgi:hypothetical protein